MHANAYRQVQSQTASKERTLVLLFEAAQRHMVDGANHLDQKQAQAATTVLGKASDIVLELWSTIDHKQAPQLGQHLEAIYQYVALELTKASTTRKSQHARNAARAFAPLVDAFQQAVAQVVAQAGAR